MPEFNRGTALGVYTAFSDVSFFLVGPIAGAIIGFFGYASVFLFALISVLSALGIVMVLKARNREHESEIRDQIRDSRGSEGIGCDKPARKARRVPTGGDGDDGECENEQKHWPVRTAHFGLGTTGFPMNAWTP